VSDDFIGSGWAFPIRTATTGDIALVSGEEEIEGSIRLILGTAPGERPMRPEFGCAIHEYTFAPTSASTIGRIAYDVRQALARWEPRIDVRDVDVVPDPEDPARLSVHILYSIRRTNDPRNLVFPFYVLPSEGTRARVAGAPAESSREE
jgi:phage baseplate assembly protein W